MLVQLDKKQLIERIADKANRGFDPAYIFSIFGLSIESMPIDDLLFGHFIDELSVEETSSVDLADIIDLIEKLSHENLDPLRQQIISIVRSRKMNVGNGAVH